MTTSGQAYLLHWGSRTIDPAGVPLGQQGGRHTKELVAVHESTEKERRDRQLAALSHEFERQFAR